MCTHTKCSFSNVAVAVAVVAVVGAWSCENISSCRSHLFFSTAIFWCFFWSLYRISLRKEKDMRRETKRERKRFPLFCLILCAAPTAHGDMIWGFLSLEHVHFGQPKGRNKGKVRKTEKHAIQIIFIYVLYSHVVAPHHLYLHNYIVRLGSQYSYE